MFKFEDDKCYLMPAHFGGFIYDPKDELYYRDAVCLNYRYTIDGDRLADFLPETGHHRLTGKSPADVALVLE